MSAISVGLSFETTWQLRPHRVLAELLAELLIACWRSYSSRADESFAEVPENHEVGQCG
jgi:hypothetical protein